MSYLLLSYRMKSSTTNGKPPWVRLSFRPTTSVARMLERSRRHGHHNISRTINEALSAWLEAKGYARKKDLCDAGRAR